MLILENDHSYHAKLKDSRKRLVHAYAQLYLLEHAKETPNESYLSALRAYLQHINLGQTPITFDDEKYSTLINIIPPSKKMQAFTSRCKNIAETRAKQAIMLACLRETLVPTLALILPCFILGAGIATALTYTSTLSAVIFFLALGGLMLFGSQLYIWRHHRKNEPNRIQRLYKLMSDFYQPSVENQALFEGVAFPVELLDNVLDRKEDIAKLNSSIGACYSWFSRRVKIHCTGPLTVLSVRNTP